jgi:aquaporin Z
VFREELAITPEEVRSGRAHVGFYSLRVQNESEVELEHIFVEPSDLRRGVGRALFDHVADILGASRQDSGARVQRFFAEALGTFALVFAGTAAIVVNDVSGGMVSHVGVAATFGLVVMAMVYAVGDVSGAHINPAVTIGFWLARRFPGSDVVPYVASQIAGALLASVLVLALFGPHAALGATLPAGSPAQSFGLEIVLTLLLMFAILTVTTGAKEKGAIAGVVIGGVVGLEALFAGPISGASMNPARSLAPALVSGEVQHLWIYLVAPPIGAALAMLACRCTHGAPCCVAWTGPAEGRDDSPR